ncbi:MAG: Rifampicin monooxygenase [Chlamydiales bacterium]|nr:Rifampicin monooxygenase [Chlamydiales bacterium]MCH9635899.1 Rifampicin monooxygenase [Chlamydiales bacterium]
MSKILVIGAGPTGLFLTYLLKKRGHNVRLIDKGSGPSIHSKALGIHSRTTEIFEKEGLGEIFRESAIHVSGLTIHCGHLKAETYLNDLDITYPYVLALPQTETEKILLDALGELGQEVEWNCEVEGYNGTIPLIGGTEVEADFVIGCDGAHSLTRKSHPYTFLGSPLHQEVLLADVMADCPFSQSRITALFAGKKLSMIFPMKGGRFRIMFTHKEGVSYKEGELDRLLEEYDFPKSFKIKEVLWFNNFHLSERMVNTFRYKNIFILGDAAHIHSPVLGQGMNTCFQDAYNLAWKLDLVLKGQCNEQLLDSVSAERLPVVRNMLRKTTAMTKLLTNQKIPLSYVIRMMKVILHFKGARHALMKNMSMVTLGYKNSAICYQPSTDHSWRAPRLGFRVDNYLLADGGCLFDHLKGHKHLLVHFNPSKPQPNCALYDTLLISDELTKRAFAARTESLFLIRPDGHLGMRCQSGSPDALKQYLNRLYYSENSERVVLDI